MVMNFNLKLEPVSVVIFAILACHWSSCIFEFILIAFKRSTLAYHGLNLKILEPIFTYDDYVHQRTDENELASSYLFAAFYDNIMMTGIVILEVFSVFWNYSKLLSDKLRIRNERYISSIFLAISCLFVGLIEFLPSLNWRTRYIRRRGKKLSLHIKEYILSWLKTAIISAISGIPLYEGLRTFQHPFIMILGIIVVVYEIVIYLVNFKFLSNNHRLESGYFKNLLGPVLKELDFSLDYIYTSKEELPNKVYIIDTAIGKEIVITGNIPGEKENSTANQKVNMNFTLEEIQSLVFFYATRSTLYHRLTSLGFLMIHLFVLFALVYELHRMEVMYLVGGFRKEKPVIINFVLVAFFFIRPYVNLIYGFFDYAHEFMQTSEATAFVINKHYGMHLHYAFLKIYKKQDIFPYHNLWYAMYHRAPVPLYPISLTGTTVTSE